MNKQVGSRPRDRGSGSRHGTKPNNNGRFKSAPESLGYADLFFIGSVSVSHRWLAKRVVCRFPAANPTYEWSPTGEPVVPSIFLSSPSATPRLSATVLGRTSRRSSSRIHPRACPWYSAKADKERHENSSVTKTKNIFLNTISRQARYRSSSFPCIRKTRP